MATETVLSVLINSIFECGRTLYKYYTKVPKYIEYEPTDKKYFGTICIDIGKTYKSKEVKLYFNNSNNNNTLIMGTSGEGKSNLIKLMLYQLVNNNCCELWLLDHKRVELTQYKTYAKVFAYNSQAIEERLEDLLELIEARYNILEQEGKYEADYTMKPIVVVIEELVLLTKEGKKLLEQILCICRSVNITIIGTIQRADSKILSPTIMTNINNIFCFRTTINNSKLILGNEMASNIVNKGNCIYNYNSEFINTQIYYIKQELIAELTSQASNTNIKNEKQNTNMKYKIQNTNSNLEIQNTNSKSKIQEANSNNNNINWYDKI